jgi:excisionase family DNA binding protein
VSNLLTVTQIQERLQIGRRHAYELLSTGQIPHFRIGKASIRISEAQLSDYLATQLAPGYTRSDSGDTPGSDRA